MSTFLAIPASYISRKCKKKKKQNGIDQKKDVPTIIFANTVILKKKKGLKPEL
jgi:effector-binding domain-containing protein